MHAGDDGRTIFISGSGGTDLGAARTLRRAATHLDEEGPRLNGALRQHGLVRVMEAGCDPASWSAVDLRQVQMLVVWPDEPMRTLLSVIGVLATRRHVSLGSLGGVDLVLDAPRAPRSTGFWEQLGHVAAMTFNDLWLLGLADEELLACRMLAEFERAS